MNGLSGAALSVGIGSNEIAKRSSDPEACASWRPVTNGPPRAGAIIPWGQSREQNLRRHSSRSWTAFSSYTRHPEHSLHQFTPPSAKSQESQGDSPTGSSASSTAAPPTESTTTNTPPGHTDKPAIETIAA